jgi:LmbE family N-acetylglucosaminyl deacetylase
VIGLSSRPITTIAVIGAHCDDIAIGAGATLMEITRRRPNVVVHALVLTGGGTVREVEEKNAFAEFCGDAQVRLTVADLPDGRLPAHWDESKSGSPRSGAAATQIWLSVPNQGMPTKTTGWSRN